MNRPRMTRRDDSLIGQVVAANLVLVALTLFAASLAAGLDLNVRDQRWQFLILALAIVLSLCVNLWMLQRRFRPLERLIRRIEAIDPSEPTTLGLGQHDPIAEIDRLSHSFTRLLDRIEEERRRSGQLAMRAQEEERRRLARDLHDEVNQALTAILLRLEALAQDTPAERADEVAELKRLVNQAMEELLTLARQLRPTVLDDLGLKAALAGNVSELDRRSSVNATFESTGTFQDLPADAQLVVYRVAQEALSNAAQHAGAAHIRVRLDRSNGAVELTVSDDGRGFTFDQANRGLGLGGMRERALLVGGDLRIESRPRVGTRVRLHLPIEKMDGSSHTAGGGVGGPGHGAGS